ncbi:MAG: hypothetical protein Q8P24_13265 [Desulfobacterales bacterium]|nr:hypothetical protein [Desulfobacterales bacterium]
MKKTFTIEVSNGMISTSMVGFMTYEILGLLELAVQDLRTQHKNRKKEYKNERTSTNCEGKKGSEGAG